MDRVRAKARLLYVHAYLKHIYFLQNEPNVPQLGGLIVGSYMYIYAVLRIGAYMPSRVWCTARHYI